jgi:large subunit ribosomal protein L29
MAKEKIQFAALANDDLSSQLARLQAEYVQTKFDHTVKGMANPMELRDMRRDIARYHTEMRHREMAEMSPEQLAARSKMRARRRRG